MLKKAGGSKKGCRRRLSPLSPEPPLVKGCGQSASAYDGDTEVQPALSPSACPLPRCHQEMLLLKYIAGACMYSAQLTLATGSFSVHDRLNEKCIHGEEIKSSKVLKVFQKMCNREPASQKADVDGKHPRTNYP
ncbi:unnamed protein product [Pleuronectes platessa]|uniref:Uncharacterized protein n=1 Tax=Pleuronectes platessa TaxID=8262 RepID=A0A9N7TNA6_PLEPL|nr:unnamed protein product [Pleuronectes platessa]